MDYLLYNISENLKRIRASRGMSLDDVASQAGISKSMLHQIEKGKANPSISVLGKIAGGLRVELTALLSSPPEKYCLMKVSNMTPTKSVPGAFTMCACFPFEENQQIEIYRIDIEPHSEYVSHGHGEGTREYISVINGILTLITDGEELNLDKDDMFRFDCSLQHTYANRTDGHVSLLCFFVV